MKPILQFFSLLILTMFFVVPSNAAETDEEFKTLRVGVLQNHPMIKRADYKNAFIFNYSNLLGVNVVSQGLKRLVL